jgi:hypothetical protein
MNRLFFTGDTHNNLQINRISFKNWPLGRDLNKNDILCVLGDFGFPWAGGKSDQYWLDWCEDRPFSVVFVDGNHVNHPLLNTYPVEEWCGGKTHILRQHVHHLMRGEIFIINNRSFFCLGGAASIDKHLRKEGRTWWPEEIPSYQEFEHAANNLRAHDMKVDYILSHTTSNRTIQKFDKWFPQFDPVTNFLDKFVEEEVDFRVNLFGHFHQDRTIDDKHILLYNDIIELLPNGEFKVVNN